MAKKAVRREEEPPSSSEETLPSFESQADKIFLTWAIPESEIQEQNSPKPKKPKIDAGALDQIELSTKKSDEINEDDELILAEGDDDVAFMKKASEEAKNSPDPDVKVGAVIVNRATGEVLGRGFNRMPKGCEKLPWSDKHEKEPLDSKYPYVFHGVKAAITDAINKQNNLKGATVYTTLFPANTDAQWIVDLGMKELVYRDNTYKHTRFAKAAVRIFKEGGIKLSKIAQGD